MMKSKRFSGCGSSIGLFFLILFIVGLIYYYTVNPVVLIVGIIIEIILVILGILSLRSGGSKKSAKAKLDSKGLEWSPDYRDKQDIMKLMDRCNHSAARRFDFSTFWSEATAKDYRDPDIAEPSTYEFFLDSCFQAGILCVSYINFFINSGISTGDYVKMRREILARKIMLDNIVYCCGGESCPQCVKIYVDEVRKILSQQACSAEQLKRIVRLVPMNIKKGDP